ncbi:hypothetical protein [Sphingobium cupriresistens]|uniref:hypothetical protein n=1 Tax=Sphingobium cupriresistens TaxID=1132417 RepID=UPI003BF4D6A6
MPLLPGLSWSDDFLTAREERALIERIEETSLTPFRYQQWQAADAQLWLEL